MLQRVAYSIYWMSRYLQRADCYARLLSAQMELADKKNIDNQWNAILVAMADDAFFYEKYPKADALQVLDYMTFDDENVNSIASVIKTARNNARSIRETIHQVNWEILNIFYLKAKTFQANPNKNLDFYQQFFKELNDFYCTFIIEINKNLIKKEAVLFFQLGGFIERSDKISRVFDFSFFNPTHNSLAVNQAVLRAISNQELSHETELIYHYILDENNKDSIRYCFKNIEKLINEISSLNADNQLIIEIKNIQNFLSFNASTINSKSDLSQLIDTFQLKNNALDQAIFEYYFVFKPIHFNLKEGEQ